MSSRLKYAFLYVIAGLFLTLPPGQAGAKSRGGGSGHYLYVAAPGIRNYLQFGGAGILVFDMDRGYRFVKRIETPASRQPRPENVKGVCANAETDRLYFTTLTRLYCLDLRTEKTLWEKKLPGGCDRLSITPNGKWLYVPSYEKDHWHVVDAMTGEIIKRIVPKSGAHNTICSLDGTRAYLAGLRSPWLTVVDARTHRVIGKVGPFIAPIRPFTVNAANTRCYVCINRLLGFEIGDIVTGKKIARVEVKGFPYKRPKRHGCPSHGIGLTPDEKEIWVCDGANSRLHVFALDGDNAKQVASIKLREQPGWVTFSRDGKVAISSTGEIIDTKTRKIVAALFDEKKREVHSEKVVEIIIENGDVIAVGDQFGLGRRGLR